MHHTAKLVGCLVALFGVADAAIGPTGNVVVANKKIAPDGYERTYASSARYFLA